MFIEPFAVLLAFIPLIGYLLVLGAIRLLGKTVVTTGGRDIATVAFAISGFVAVGPAELFFPNAAATVFGPTVWLALIAFYALVVALIVLTARPKLVAFGRTPEELFEPLLIASRRIDSDAVGDLSTLQVHLPSLGVHLRLDGQRGIDYAQIVAFEAGVSLRFWGQLLGHLRTEVAALPAPQPRRGFTMVLVAFTLIGLLLWQGISHQAQVVEGFRDWLWR
jgi:hypothetical protein